MSSVACAVTSAGPAYVPVHIDATVFFRPQYGASLVQQQVEQTVAALLAFDATGFNQTLYISKIYEVIQEIGGVAGVSITTFAQGSADAAGSLPLNGQLTFGVANPAELPWWQGFDGVTSHLTMTPGTN